MKKLFTTLLLLTFTCVLSLPNVSYGRSYSSRSRSYGRSHSSRSNRSHSSPGFLGSKSTKPTPSVSSKRPTTKSNRANSMRNQTKHRTQTQNKVKTQAKPHKTMKNNSQMSTTQTRTRKKVIVKKYYYHGRPSYLYYNHGRYYDPWGYSPTWWLLHWAELEQQREILNDVRYISMKAQVDALRAQGVVPDPSYTEDIAPIPDSAVRPIATYGVLFYIITLIMIVVIAFVLIVISGTMRH